MTKASPVRSKVGLKDVWHVALETPTRARLAGQAGVLLLERGAKEPQVIDSQAAVYAERVGERLLVIPGAMVKWKHATAWPELRHAGKTLARYAVPKAKWPWIHTVSADHAGRAVLVLWRDMGKLALSSFELESGTLIRHEVWASEGTEGFGAAWTMEGDALVWLDDELRRVPAKGKITSTPAPIEHERFAGGYGDKAHLRVTPIGDAFVLAVRNDPTTMPAVVADGKGAIVHLGLCDVAHAAGDTILRARGETVDVLGRDGKVRESFVRDTKVPVRAAAALGGTWIGASEKAVEWITYGVADGRAQTPKRAREAQPDDVGATAASNRASADPRPRLWEAPTDMAALAVCGDWFLERNANARGEYIQLALTKKRTAAQEARRKKLGAGASDWLGDARPFVGKWRPSEETPGFFDWVKCTPTQLLEGGQHFRWLGPRLTVELSRVKKLAEAKSLATLDLPWLHGLVLDSGDTDWLTESVLAAIAPLARSARAVVIGGGHLKSERYFWPVLEAATNAEILAFTGSYDALQGVAKGPRSKARIFKGSPENWPAAVRDLNSSLRNIET